MWNGKKKALTFSFDDGVLQDKRAIGILDRYGLKATFNINSGLLGCKNKLNFSGNLICHDKISVGDVARVYAGHEVAAHTLSHPNLTETDEATVIYQVSEDIVQLGKLTGKKIVGMAYPGGPVNNDERVAEIIGKNTSVRYARTVTSTYGFDLPTNLLRLNPTVHLIDPRLFETAERFLSTEPDTPQLFYIWGHTYEMDAGLIAWEKFEEFCKTVSGQENVFYGTNSEVLLR